MPALPILAAFVLGSACSSSEPADDPGVVGPVDAASSPTTQGDAGGVTDTEAGDAGADAPPGPVFPGSGGKGGLTCTRQDDLGGGRKSCVAMVGSVELKLVEAKGGSGPMRLGLYLHGDGAAAHLNNGVLKAMMPWADAQHGLAVSALAPNGCAWWLALTHDCSSTQNDRDVAGDNVAPLVAAIEALMHAYDVRTDGIRYYGSSGGSIFLTNAWIPLEGASYPGVYSIMCGGERSPRTYAWNTNDAVLRAKNPLWFTYGDQDDLVPEIEKSIADFKAKSFMVTEKIIPGAGHCEFDSHGEAIGIWTANP